MKSKQKYFNTQNFYDAKQMMVLLKSWTWYLILTPLT